MTRNPSEIQDRLPLGPERSPVAVNGIDVAGGLGPASGKTWPMGLMGAGATHETAGGLLAALDRVLG